MTVALDQVAEAPAPEVARRLAAALAERAPGFHEADAFVHDNDALLKEAGLVEAGVPREPGGGVREAR